MGYAPAGAPRLADPQVVREFLASEPAALLKNPSDEDALVNSRVWRPKAGADQPLRDVS